MRGNVLIPALVLTLGLAAGRPASAEFAYAIGDGGSSLIRFSTDSPGSATRVGSFGANMFLDAIDFRPATGELYGYSDLADRYYTVNLNTAALTQVSADPVGATTNTFFLGMDFNPMIDRLRVVTESTQNIVFNPDAGTAAAFTNLFYAPGDVSAGLAPLVIDNAYSNNFPGTASTQQYVLDYDQNSLATLANNAGTLSTVGKVTLNGTVLDFDEFSGFDILSSLDGANTAYALLKVGGVSGLYSIDLANGNATSLGSLGAFASPTLSPYSLAIQSNAIPEPASAMMVGLGVGALGLVASRRRLSRRRA